MYLTKLNVENKPLYFDSWKGMVARAIVLDGARTWTEIRDSTGLPRNSFNKVLAEMLSSKALEKKDDKTYRRAKAVKSGF